MRKCLFSVIALCCLLACSSEIDDLKKDIADLEEQARLLQKQQDSIKKVNDETQQNIDKTQDEIDKTLWDINKVSLAYFEFLHEDNPFQVVEDTRCEIAGDSIVCWVSNIMPNKVLIPRFSYEGKSLTIDGKPAESGVTSFDFGKPLKLTISSDLRTKDYEVYVYSYTGLPVVWLTTAKMENISVSEKIYQGTVKIVENARTRKPGDVIENAYRFTLNTVKPVLDGPTCADWELLSNAIDPTLLHTQAGFHFGKISNLHFTPTFHFADLMLNERYYGTYLLGDVIDYTRERTDVGIDGYIVKIDASAAKANFKTAHIEQPVSVVYPSVTSGDDEYRNISNILKTADAALFSSNFTDADEGWQKYLDMDSFVDWYLINEIAKNEEGAFSADCYMNMKRDGKLRMGPLWKMEKSFGYDESSTSGFVIKEAKWFDRLFQDPIFVEKVKERFTHFYNHKNDILKEIDADAYYLRNAIPENNNKWEVFEAYTLSELNRQYKNEVTAMKSWLEKRLDWLNEEFSKM